jgi:pimeloyl-ACP methyl ester carboxylesterase
MRFHAADTRALYAHPDLEEAVARVFLHYRRLNLDTLMSYFKFMPEIDITAQLPRIQAQTLVVAGDSDPIVPPEQSHRITSLINDTELAINEDAGHLPIFERPDKYHVTLSGWLERTRLAA